MADEMMTTPNGQFDPIAQWARLSERVENQGKDIIDLRSNMNTGFQNIQSSLASLSRELQGSTKTQWPVIWSAAAVCVTVLGGLGIILLQPVKDNIAEAKASISELAKVAITRKEMDWRSDRAAEDRSRLEKSIANLREDMIGRPEWAERSKLVDQAVVNADRRNDDTNKRIDELRQDFGAVYGTRDVIRDMKSEIDELRQRLNVDKSPLR